VITLHTWVRHIQHVSNVKKCKFCICPEGNGFDCHRLWECLYLDVIPICEKSVFIDNDLTIDDQNKLDFNYWKNKNI
jgi:hypothetical protein